jgi:hypothetical protein
MRGFFTSLRMTTKNKQRQKQVPYGDDNKKSKDNGKSKNKDNGKSKSEMRGFFASLRMTIISSASIRQSFESLQSII